MDPQPPNDIPAQTDRDVRLDSLLSSIELNCGISTESPVLFIGDENDHLTPAQDTANRVFDSLMMKLDDIGEYAVTEAKKRKGFSSLQTQYENVATGIGILAQVAKNVADNKIPLVRNEEEYAQSMARNDHKVTYVAKDVKIEDSDFEEIRVFIRKGRTKLEPLPGQNGNLRHETGNPHMIITVRTQNGDTYSMRLEQGPTDLDKNKPIVTEISVPEGLMNVLDFPKETGWKRDSRRFDTGTNLKGLKAEFPEVLEAFSEQIERNIATNTSATSLRNVA